MLARLMVLAASAAFIGCGAARVEQPAELLSETENTVALCQGGWTDTTERELAAELSRREGRIISREEVTQRGANTFRFGDREGEAAVDMFNTYVACVLGVMQERTRRGLATAPGGKTDGASPPLSQAPETATWELYEVGRIPSGERVIQVPVPGETRLDDEIQLHVVLPAGQSTWGSRGTPQWSTAGCTTGWSRAQLLGSGTSYTARFYISSILGPEHYDEQICRVRLRAALTEEEWIHRTELHNRDRDRFSWWDQYYTVVIPRQR